MNGAINFYEACRVSASHGGKVWKLACFCCKSMAEDAEPLCLFHLRADKNPRFNCINPEIYTPARRYQNPMHAGLEHMA